MATFLETLTVPLGTPLDTPVQQELIVTPGSVVALRLYVPPGPRGELYLRLLHRGVQVLPARTGTWWRLDNVVLTQPLDVVVLKGDAFFYLQGASPTASFNHSVDFELIVDPSEKATPALSASTLLERLAGIFGR